MNSTKTLALIDGDELVYKAGFASQTTVYHVLKDENEVGLFPNKHDAIEFIGNDEGYDIQSEIVVAEEDIALMSLRAVYNTIMSDVNTTDFRIYLSGENNFRRDVATIAEYKGNRDESSKPVYLPLLKEVLKDRYGAIVVDGIEADDALSITQWHHYTNKTNWGTIIVTQDKDLDMVPGVHYNPSKRESTVISPKDARLSFYSQLLSGDNVDNIPGIYRIAKKTAMKKLAPLIDHSNNRLINFVIEEYEKAYQNPKISKKMDWSKLGKDRITELGQLLWMLQFKDQIWSPDENYYRCVGLE